MKVSIIIPIYNVSAYVEECLSPILNQTYKDIEIIIVNDKTKDDSMAVITNIINRQKDEHNIKIIEHPVNKGLSAARNTGIEHSTGDYLYFVDSDDKITIDCIEKLSNAAKESQADIVVGDYKVEGSDAYFPPLKLKSSFIKENSKIIKAYMREKIYVMAWNKLVRTEFIKQNKLYFKEGVIHEDCLWSFQCACMAHNMAIVKEQTYIYRIRTNSITSGTTFLKDLPMQKTIVAEMVSFAHTKGLLENKYIALFIEKEKLRIFLRCLNAKENQCALELYDFIYHLPHPDGRVFTNWNFFNLKALIRDTHYLLSYPLGKEYYQQLPNLLFKRRHKLWFKIYFYIWLLYILRKPSNPRLIR